MLVLEPRLAILDETDSGPRHRRAEGGRGRASTRCARPSAPCVLVTHYQRLLDYVVPDFVHVLVRGAHRAQRRQARSRSSSSGAATTGSRARRPDGIHERCPRRPHRRGLRGSAAAALPPPWPRRRAGARARSCSSAAGLPTTRDENWKYANLRPLERAALRCRPRRAAAVTAAQLPPRRSRLRPLRVRRRAFAPALSAAAAAASVFSSLAAALPAAHAGARRTPARTR